MRSDEKGWPDVWQTTHYSVSLHEVLSGDRSNVTWHEHVWLHQLNILDVRFSSSSSSRISSTVSLICYFAVSARWFYTQVPSHSLSWHVAFSNKSCWCVKQFQAVCCCSKNNSISICLPYCWLCDKPAKAGRVLLNLSNLALFGLWPFDGVAMLQIQMSRLSMRGELHARRAEKESGGPFTEAARQLYHLATLGSRGVRIFSFHAA